MIELLDQFVTAYKAEYDEIPLWEGDFHIYNNWIGAVDAEMLYCFVRDLQPKRIIEIGAGMSSKCIALARAKGDPLLRGTHIAIDPDPREELPASVFLHRAKLEDIDLAIFDQLEAGDILSIDSSHSWALGNDVDLEYHQILPSLKPGVVVHCHDIFLPDDYPSWWGHRGYDEQTHLATLLARGDWDVLWSSHQMQGQHAPRLYGAFRSFRSYDYPASFWMRRT